VPTLLIADDEPTLAEIFSRMLWESGRTILTAGSAEEALRLAHERGPVDVALVDRNFGAGSGIQVARDLRALQGTEVVLVTAYASTDSAIEAFQAGVYDYVSKPIDDFDALRLRVSNAFERVKLRRERKVLADRLAESEERHRLLFESAPDLLVVHGLADGRILEVNPAAVARFGRRRDGLLDAPVASLFEEPPAWLSTAGHPDGVERVQCLAASGEVFPSEVRCVDLELGGRRLRSLTLRDVSERERLVAARLQMELQLRQAQKMDAVGRLAGGIGHDLANMFAVILSYVEELAAGAEGDARACLLEVQGAANRATWLVRQMMTLSRMGPSPASLVSPSHAVSEMEHLLKRSLGERARIETHLPADTWPVLVDRNQLGQVVLNLVLNARDAMPDGGLIVLRTGNVLAEARTDDGLPPGPMVSITVSDEGVGMSREVLDRIFEPFFTTKESGKGTGLGLAICYGIVRQAGGAIDVESAPGRGTTVRVLLPKGKEPAVAAPPPGAIAATRLGGGTALVAEDDDGVRSLLARTLRQAGFSVLQRGTGEDALQAAEEHEGRIDLLVTDAVMGKLSGPALATGVHRRHPACRVLLVTGFPTDPAVTEFVERGGDVLWKPFRASELLDRIRRLLPGS